MIPRTDSPESALAEAIGAWFALLAAGRLAEACAQLDEPNSYGISWTPDRLRRVLHETFAPESVFGRSHPEGAAFSAPDQPPQIELIAAGDGGYVVDVPVHLNGELSDLTAQFELRPRASGWALVLHDLHVL
jgi:hypothetical protein